MPTESAATGRYRALADPARRGTRLAGQRDRRAALPRQSVRRTLPAAARGGSAAHQGDHAPAHPASAIPGRSSAVAAGSRRGRAEPARVRHLRRSAVREQPGPGAVRGRRGLSPAARSAARQPSPRVWHLCRPARAGLHRLRGAADAVHRRPPPCHELEHGPARRVLHRRPGRDQRHPAGAGPCGRDPRQPPDHQEPA